MAGVSNAVNDLKAFLPFLNELKNDLRRIFKVGVEFDDRVSGRERKARENRVLITEVSREAVRLKMRLACRKPLKNRPSRIGRAVVGNDDFERVVIQLFFEKRFDLGDSALDQCRFIEGRYAD